MVASLAAQSYLPDQVVIVDEEGEGNALAAEFSQVKITVRTFPQGSASAKRNVGLECVAPETELVSFMDDDITLESNALEVMLDFWEKAPADLGGAGFNFRNIVARETARKWKLRPVVWIYEAIMLTHERKGKVLPSGFPTPIYPVSEDTYVDWLETLALVFRNQVVRQFHFDEFFEGYSYLEFLDYTYSISRKFKLCVVSAAWVTHHSSPIKHSYLLGKKQIMNRVFFVRKHPELSLFRCCVTLVLHTFFNVVVGMLLRDAGYMRRACGNCVGLAEVSVGRMRPVQGGIK
jgi:glycosyltransferase involved in cell wall biosynthesis